MKTNILKKQRKLRLYQIKDIGKLKKLKETYKLPIEVRIKLIKKIGKIKVFLVDGNRIRNFIDIDFTTGGHGFRHLYIPLDEIWVDSSNEDEKEEIIIHELKELKLMKKGINYNTAHDLACLEELKLRTKRLFLPVGHHRQINPWSCGPSALKIVLDYYNDNKNIKELIKKTNCNKNGTLHEGFKKALLEFGYDFIEKENSKIEDIEEFIRQGIPVIVDYQAYHGGHFSVVIGYDENKLFISDPASDKKYKEINKEDFKNRWYDEDTPGRIVKRWLLAIKKKNHLFSY